MKQDKVIFGEAHSIVEQTKNPGLIARDIKRHEAKVNKQKAKSNNNKSHVYSKKPNSFSK